MESRAIEEKQISEARDKVRAQFAKVERVSQQIKEDVDISDVPPHLLGT
jgi:uncharacterized coiled-coil protein SlyX